MPLLLLYKNQMLAEETKVVKRHLQRQNSRLIVAHYLFFDTSLFTLPKILRWGGGAQDLPPPLPPLCACCNCVVAFEYFADTFSGTKFDYPKAAVLVASNTHALFARHTIFPPSTRKATVSGDFLQAGTRNFVNFQ